MDLVNYSVMSLKRKLQEAAVAVVDLRRQLLEAERNYDALFKQATGGTRAKRVSVSPSLPDNQPKSQVATGNFTDRISALLVSNAEKTWNYAEIHKNLPDVPITTIPSLLFRLQSKGKAVKSGRGKWKSA